MMIRRIFTSSTTEDDVLEVMEDYEKKRYSTESDEGVSDSKSRKSTNLNETQQDLNSSSESSPQQQHGDENVYSPNSYFDLFNKMSKSKKHSNKISSICLDNRHKNNTIYTSAMDGISCRWMM